MIGKLDRIARGALGVAVVRPRLVLAVIAVITAALGAGVPKVSIDATSDALLLENDPAIRFYDEVRDEMSTDDYIIVSVEITQADRAGRLHWFTRARVEALARLSDTLGALDGVERDDNGQPRVQSMLSVPLYRSPLPAWYAAAGRLAEPMYLRDEDLDLDLALARVELLANPIVLGNLITADERAATILVPVQHNAAGLLALARSHTIADQIAAARTSGSPTATLEVAMREQTRIHLASYDRFSERRRQLVEDIGAIAARWNQTHAASATLPAAASADEPPAGYHVRLSGLPVLVTEMIDALAQDLVVFGFGSFGVLALVLFVFFRRVRFVLVPVLTCAVTVTWVVGLMGHVGERMTIVSANLVSLLFVVSMAHAIHLVVRLREIQARRTQHGDDRLRMLVAMRAMWWPCVFTALTTGVGFGALITSDIAPVMVFGTYMAIGAIVAIVVSFATFPALLMTLGVPPVTRLEPRSRRRRALAVLSWAAVRGRFVVPIAMVAVALVSVLGIRSLSVETRLVDYFHEGSTVRDSLTYIDQHLGGTTVLEVVLTAEPGTFGKREALAATERVRDYLAAQPNVGAVLTPNDFVHFADGVVDDLVVDLVGAGVMSRLARNAAYAQALDHATPGQITADRRRVRITARVRETTGALDRDKLLGDLRSSLAADPALAGYDVQVSGIFVLYTNMINSLMTSQFESIGFVFLTVLVMLIVLFRSVTLGLIGMLPNLVPVALVLAVMGWTGIPLNIMTVTIAAIALGIAVDGTIHYVNRLRHEIDAQAHDPADTLARAVDRTHQSIGHAIVVTAVAIIGGLGVMVLSGFLPTAYFGAFTALAMLAALLGTLTVLPAAILLLKPRSLRRAVGASGPSGAPTRAQ